MTSQSALRNADDGAAYGLKHIWPDHWFEDPVVLGQELDRQYPDGDIPELLRARLAELVDLEAHVLAARDWVLAGTA